jgi:UDP-2,3-diacylglucosamine pyrophosphatase LpxH
MSWRTALILPDAHAPYHHKKGLANALEVGKSIGCHELYILGDFLDFYFANMHGPKHPLTICMAKEEIELGNAVLDEIDALFPNIKKTYIEGNHEYRLERFLIARASELFGITDWVRLLNLDKRPNWHVVPYGVHQRTRVLNTDLWARHEPKSMSSAKANLNKALTSYVHGHTHRAETYKRNTDDGRLLISACPGWLGDIKYDKIFGFVKHLPDWTLGFGVCHGHAGSRRFHYSQYSMHTDGSIFYNGKTFK